MTKDFIEETVKSSHLKWLEKAKTAKINGSEMTVLPYGYLGQAIEEALQSQRTEMLKAVEELKKYESHIGIGGLHNAEMQTVYNSALTAVKESLSANQ